MQKPPYIMICGKKSPKEWHGFTVLSGQVYGEYIPGLFFVSSLEKCGNYIRTNVLLACNNETEWRPYRAPLDSRLGRLLLKGQAQLKKNKITPHKTVRASKLEFVSNSKTTHRIDCVYEHIHIYKK